MYKCEVCPFMKFGVKQSVCVVVVVGRGDAMSGIREARVISSISGGMY